VLLASLIGTAGSVEKKEPPVAGRLR